MPISLVKATFTTYHLKVNNGANKMKAYSVICVLASALTWFLTKSDSDLSFPIVLALCFIMPIVAESCGVMKKENRGTHL